MIPGRGSQGGRCDAAGLDENGIIGELLQPAWLIRQRWQQQGWWQTQSGEAALPFLTKREGFELLPNVWWQAVARKSESLGKSSHKDQQQKARGGGRRNG